MKRLIEKDKQGNWCLRGVTWESLHEGKMITRDLWERLYGALWKLMEYEDTELSPEDVVRLNDFERSQIADLLRRLGEERKKYRWIPVEEQLPEKEGMVLVQVSGRPVENITLHNALEMAEYNPEEGWILKTWPEWDEVEPVVRMPLPEAYRPEI